MAQNKLNYGENPSGADLMDVYLAGMAENQLTLHSGNSRPSYVQQGTMWLNTSANPYILYVFDGTVDVKVGEFNITNKTFKANDTLNVMHLTGNETIAGTKTFTNSQNVKTTNNNIALYLNDFDRTEEVSSSVYKTPVVIRDKNGTLLLTIHYDKLANGAEQTSLQVSKVIGGTTKYSGVKAGFLSDGTAFADCPTPPATSNTNHIATTAWVNTKLANYVDKTSDETIGGRKTATGNWTFNNALSIPTSENWKNFIAMQGEYFPYIAGYSNNTDTALALCTKRNGNFYNLEIHNNGDGTGRVTCPTPLATSNDSSIATTEWSRLLPIRTSFLNLTKYGDITNLPYTAPVDGYMRVRCGATYWWELLINGTVYQKQDRNSSDSCVTVWTTIPVKRGDVLTFNSGTGHFDGGAMYYTY